MSTPIILADNRFLDGTVIATGISNNSQYNIIDGRPYTWLTFSAAGTNYVSVDCTVAKSASAIGIIGHNLASASAVVIVQSSTNNSTWTDRLTFSPTSDKAALRTFTKATARYWRIQIVTAAVAPRLAVCMLGERIDFPWPPDAPFVPYTETVEADQNDSKTGNPLGVVVRYFPVTIKPTFSNIDRDWAEDVFLPFRQTYGRYRKYFFWAWDLEVYPDQVHFVQDSGSYAPEVSVLPFYSKLSLELKGVMER